MPSIFSFDDLNTTIDNTPRIKDYLLGEKLGFSRPTKIREIIKRNIEELRWFGICARYAGTSSIANGTQREVSEYWLNESQAIYVCMRSRAKNSTEIRKEILKVFEELRTHNNQGLSGEKMHSHTHKLNTTGELCNV